jgi:hypothetical protein
MSWNQWDYSTDMHGVMTLSLEYTLNGKTKKGESFIHDCH